MRRTQLTVLWVLVHSGWFRLALVVAAVRVGVTGHFGGILVHGADFFTVG